VWSMAGGTTPGSEPRRRHESPSSRADPGRRGTQVHGASRVRGREARALSASPSANPAGRRERSTIVSPVRALAHLICTVTLLAAPAAASAAPSAGGSGGAAYAAAAPAVAPAAPRPAGRALRPEVPGTVARLRADGTASAPAAAPPAVKAAIWAANELTDRPYVYGGGHASFAARGYDCSGTVSFALHAAGLLSSPLDSGSFMAWGARGRGRWITVYTNPGHAYAVIAGLRLDTSAAGVPYASAGKAVERGPRWRPAPRSAAGFVRRHPAGF
jgi:cell wall-associated NlpC family hydrolase